MPVDSTADEITQIAQALTDVIDGIEGVTGYTWERREFDSLPAGAVGPPELRRTDLDQPESQLGTNDWYLDFPLSFYFDLDQVTRAQADMVRVLADFSKAIDADESLDLTAFDAAITAAVPFVETNRTKPLCGYEVTVAIWRLVP